MGALVFGKLCPDLWFWASEQPNACLPPHPHPQSQKSSVSLGIFSETLGGKLFSETALCSLRKYQMGQLQHNLESTSTLQICWLLPCLQLMPLAQPCPGMVRLISFYQELPRSYLLRCGPQITFMLLSLVCFIKY